MNFIASHMKSIPRLELNDFISKNINIIVNNQESINYVQYLIEESVSLSQKNLVNLIMGDKSHNLYKSAFIKNAISKQSFCELYHNGFCTNEIEEILLAEIFNEIAELKSNLILSCAIARAFSLHGSMMIIIGLKYIRDILLEKHRNLTSTSRDVEYHLINTNALSIGCLIEELDVSIKNIQQRDLPCHQETTFPKPQPNSNPSAPQVTNVTNNIIERIESMIKIGDSNSAINIGNKNSNQIQTQSFKTKPEVSLKELSSDLKLIIHELQREPGNPENLVAIGSLKAAELSAEQDNAADTYKYLKSAGKFSLSVAEKLGLPLALEALRIALTS